MDRSAYDNMRAVQDRHWWFRGRRSILADQLSRLELKPGARILEVGCGPGGNLEMLARFGDVTGLEPDEESRRYASERTGLPVVHGLLPDGLPAFDQRFDLIAALDVVEHLDDDAGALAALRDLLAPGGVLLTTVPAHPWMWSRHDALHHHKRRYRRDDYVRLLRETGYVVRRATFFNSVLYPIIALARLARASERTGRTDDAVPAPPVNALLAAAFASERFPLRVMNLPFGVSLLTVAQAANSHAGS